MEFVCLNGPMGRAFFLFFVIGFLIMRSICFAVVGFHFGGALTCFSIRATFSDFRVCDLSVKCIFEKHCLFNIVRLYI